jgi:hypothetical protein
MIAGEVFEVHPDLYIILTPYFIHPFKAITMTASGEENKTNNRVFSENVTEVKEVKGSLTRNFRPRFFIKNAFPGPLIHGSSVRLIRNYCNILIF